MYRSAFETMRKELVQHDEQLEKEKEDARRRDADPCSQRPGDLLQNLVQISVTKALMDLTRVTDTQDEAEEVDGEEITRAIANSMWGPGEGQGQYQRERREEKATEKRKRSQGERLSARARARTSANERREGETRQKELQ